MPTLDQLAQKAKIEIRRGDSASSNAEAACVHAANRYYAAGKLLIAAKNHPDMKRGDWLPYLKKHEIAERTARTYMALASGKQSLKEIREAARERMRLVREDYDKLAAEHEECSAAKVEAPVETTPIAPTEVTPEQLERVSAALDAHEAEKKKTRAEATKRNARETSRIDKRSEANRSLLDVVNNLMSPCWTRADWPPVIQKVGPAKFGKFIAMLQYEADLAQATDSADPSDDDDVVAGEKASVH